MTLCRKTLIKVSLAQLTAHANRKSGGCLVASRRVLSPMNVFGFERQRPRLFFLVCLFVHIPQRWHFCLFVCSFIYLCITFKYCDVYASYIFMCIYGNALIKKTSRVASLALYFLFSCLVTRMTATP